MRIGFVQVAMLGLLGKCQNFIAERFSLSWINFLPIWVF